MSHRPAWSGMRLTREAVPHVITASRVVFVAAAYVAAWANEALWVVALALVAVVTDIVDGILARRWNVESTFGANLDSAVDFIFYMSLVVWVGKMRPEVIRSIWPWVIVFTIAYVAVLILAKIRRGTMGFHNFWTRTAATVGVVVALVTIAFGWNPLFLLALIAAGVADLGQRFAKIFGAKPPPYPAAETARR